MIAVRNKILTSWLSNLLNNRYADAGWTGFQDICTAVRTTKYQLLLLSSIGDVIELPIIATDRARAKPLLNGFLSPYLLQYCAETAGN